MNKMFKILELSWLVAGIIGILMCSYFIIIKDFNGAKYFLGFTLVSGILYSIRRRQRLKQEAAAKKKEENKKS